MEVSDLLLFFILGTFRIIYQRSRWKPERSPTIDCRKPLSKTLLQGAKLYSRYAHFLITPLAQI